MSETYFNEGDKCPKCNDGILIVEQECDTGWNKLVCQNERCLFDASDYTKEDFQDE